MCMHVSEICAEGIFVSFPWWLKKLKNRSKIALFSNERHFEIWFPKKKTITFFGRKLSKLHKKETILLQHFSSPMDRGLYYTVLCRYLCCQIVTLDGWVSWFRWGFPRSTLAICKESLKIIGIFIRCKRAVLHKYHAYVANFGQDMFIGINVDLYNNTTFTMFYIRLIPVMSFQFPYRKAALILGLNGGLVMLPHLPLL